jgi:hypothetical protein
MKFCTSGKRYEFCINANNRAHADDQFFAVKESSMATRADHTKYLEVGRIATGVGLTMAWNRTNPTKRSKKIGVRPEKARPPTNRATS